MKASLYQGVRFVILAAMALLGLAGGPAPAGVLARGDLRAWRAPDQRLSIAAAPAAEPLSVELTATKVITVVADTELRQAAPATNLGDELPLYVGFKDGQPSRILLDLPLWRIPAGATINSATLQVYVGGWYDYQDFSRTITAYRVASLWHELLATWNRPPTTAEAVGTISVGTPMMGTWYPLDLTNQVRAWHNGTQPNYGLMLIGPEGGEPVYRVLSSGETTNYPRLTVNYTANAPALGAAPASLAFLADSQRALPERQYIYISNAGSTPLDWQASPSAGWMTLSSISGALSPGGSGVIAVQLNKAGLTPGAYTGQVQISSATAGVTGSPQTVAVSLGYAGALQSTYLPLVGKGYTGTPPPAPRKTAALLIGITNYKHLPPSAVSQGANPRAGEWGDPLMFPRNDGVRTGVVLQNFRFFDPEASSSALEWPAAAVADELLLLTESQATHADIETAFQWLDDHEDADTLVYIGYSGHGGLAGDANGDEADGWDEFIAAYDTNVVSNAFVNIFTDDDLDARLAQLESQRVVVVLDSCFSGGLAEAAGLAPSLTGRGLATRGVSADGVVQDIGRSGRVIVTASLADQESFETTDLEQGVFTYFWLMALMDPAADAIDHNGWISAEEAHAYAAPRVDALVFPRAGQHQNPQLYDGVSGNVDLTHP